MSPAQVDLSIKNDYLESKVEISLKNSFSFRECVNAIEEYIECQ